MSLDSKKKYSNNCLCDSSTGGLFNFMIFNCKIKLMF